MVEYVVVIFIAIGAIITMSIFVQRTLQARIRGARHYMIKEAAVAHGNFIRYEYEPYYGNVQSEVSRSQDDDTRLLESPEQPSGIFRKFINQQVMANTISVQAPPRDAQ